MLKQLKSLFIVEDETSDAKKKTAPAARKAPARNPAQPRPITVTPTVSQSAEGRAGKVTDKFMNVLLGAMERANLEGFDYLEFKKSLRSLAKMPMDDKTRFQSAFAMAQSMGVTPQHLLNSANHYIQALHQEEQKFEQALAKQRQQQIGDRERQIQQLDQLVKSKAEQIKKLTEEIEKHQREAEKMRADIQQKTSKIETTKNDFIATYNQLVGQIGDDVVKMKEYLK